MLKKFLFLFTALLAPCVPAFADDPHIAEAYVHESGEVLFRVEVHEREVGFSGGATASSYESRYPEGWYTHRPGATNAYRLSLPDGAEHCSTVHNGVLVSFDVQTQNWRCQLRAHFEYRRGTSSHAVAEPMSIGNDNSSVEFVPDGSLVRTLNQALEADTLKLVEAPVTRELLLAGTTPSGDTYILDADYSRYDGEDPGTIRVHAFKITSTKKIDDLGPANWDPATAGRADMFYLSNGEVVFAAKQAPRAPTSKSAGTLRTNKSTVDLLARRFFHPVEMAEEFGLDRYRYVLPPEHVPCADLLVPPAN